MRLSEAIREWKGNITPHMAVEYVLTLRADINAFSDAAQALEAENEGLKKRLAQCELFREVVGDPTHEFASLRRELHRVERENAKLRELANAMLQYIDPASHQDTCGIECPAHGMCKGKSMCAFPDWAVMMAGELGIEVDA